MGNDLGSVTSKLLYICWSGREPAGVEKWITIPYKKGDDLLTSWTNIKAEAKNLLELTWGCRKKEDVRLTMPKEFTNGPLNFDFSCGGDGIGYANCLVDKMVAAAEIYVASLPPKPMQPVSGLPYPCMSTENTPVKKSCKL